MVTPKQSQKILVYSINWALNKLIDASSNAGFQIKGKTLREILMEGMGDKTDKNKVSKVAYSLKRNKYIEITKGSCVELTNKAKIKMIDKISDLGTKDSKLRIISFDIPEEKKNKRDRFRRALKNMGFKQIQKSLWVSDKNLGELVEMAAEEFQVDKYIAYFVVERTNINKHISNLLK